MHDSHVVMQVSSSDSGCMLVLFTVHNQSQPVQLSETSSNPSKSNLTKK